MKALTAILAVLLGGVFVALLLFGGKFASDPSSRPAAMTQEQSVQIETEPITAAEPETSQIPATDIIGMWKYAGIEVFYDSMSDDEIQNLKDANANLEAYFVFNEDHTAANTFIENGSPTIHEGSWSQLTPDLYKYTYPYYSEVTKKTSDVESTITISDGKLYEKQFDTGTSYILLIYERVQ